jgi:hypothetical protein
LLVYTIGLAMLDQVNRLPGPARPANGNRYV